MTASNPNHLAIRDIATLANVGRTAVNNWTKRHEDFPQPVAVAASGGPLFDCDEVLAWAQRHGKRMQSPTGDIAQIDAALTSIRTHVAEPMPATLLALSLLTLHRLGPYVKESAKLSDLRRRVEAGHRRTQEPVLADVLRSLGMFTPPVFPAVQQFNAALESAAQPDHARYTEHVINRLLGSGGRNRSQAWGIDESRANQLLAEASQSWARNNPSGTIYDPVCGIGGALLAAARASSASTVIGNDHNPDAARVARLRFHLHDLGLETSEIDVLRHDPHPGLLADLVIAEPIAADRPSAPDRLGDSRWAGYTIAAGTLDADAAFLLDVAAHIRPGGRGFVLTTANTLTSTKMHHVRTQLVARDQIDAVIELPRGYLPYRTSTPVLWVLQAPNDHSAAPRVRLLDASSTQPANVAVGEWLEALWTENPLELPHGTVTLPDITTGGSELLPSQRLQNNPSTQQVVKAWEKTSESLNEAIETAEDAFAVFEVDRGLFSGADTVVTLRDLIDAEAARQVKCQVTKPARGSARTVYLIDAGYQPDGDADGTSPEATAPPGVVEVGVIADFDAAQSEDVVFSVIGSSPAFVNRFGIELGLTSTRRAIRLDPERLNPDYVVACINASWNAATATSGGAPRRSFDDIRIPLIPLHEQAELAEFLDDLDDVADCARKVQTEAKRLADATLNQLRFGESSKTKP